jgi:hypothetical protein
MHREVFGTTNLFVLVYETGVSSQACDATNMALAAEAQTFPHLKVEHYRLKRDLEKPEMETVLPVRRTRRQESTEPPIAAMPG